MNQESPARMLPKVQIRMEEEFRQKLMEAAFKADRSLNAEIMARLEKSFDDDSAAKAVAEKVDEIDGFVADHEKTIADYEKRIADLERRMDDVYHMSGWRDYPENENH